MNLIFAIGIAIIFGCGAYLMLKHDLIRVIVGMSLIGNAANLFIMASSLLRGEAPVLPVVGEVSDPLTQALTLTAIVIGFATSALVLSIAYRVYNTHKSVDLISISRAEVEQADRDDHLQSMETTAEEELANRAGEPEESRKEDRHNGVIAT